LQGGRCRQPCFQGRELLPGVEAGGSRQGDNRAGRAWSEAGGMRHAGRERSE
jgi:hypothetical protein